MISEKIEVSIICNAFNHEKYIKKALDSFVMQKTTFRYEILVHDDASTDKTASIIKEYEKKYPNLIFPIYQTENKYSQKINISRTFQYPRAQGKYVAVCEGDDFWLSPNKLQLQYDYMEAHPECSLCISNSKIFSVDETEVKQKTIVQESSLVSAEEVIMGGGGFCATNSIFTLTEYMLKRPDYFEILAIDLVTQMYLASIGTTYCFSESLVAYRQGVKGSWTERMKNPVKKIEHLRKVILVYEAFDAQTNAKYHNIITQRIDETFFKICWLKGDFKALNGSKYKQFYKKLSFKDKIWFQLQKRCPCIYTKLHKWRSNKKAKQNQKSQQPS